MPDQWKIEFYEEGENRQPVDEFIQSLQSNPGLQAKVLRTIRLLAEFGTTLSLPGQRMVLLHGFVKKTQKTSERDLAIGARRLQSLLRREHQ